MNASWLMLVNKKVNFSFSISHTTLRPPLLTRLSTQGLRCSWLRIERTNSTHQGAQTRAPSKGVHKGRGCSSSWHLKISPQKPIHFHKCLTGDVKLKLEVIWSLPTKWQMKNFHILKCWTMTEENVEKKQRVFRGNNTNFRKLRSLIPKFT